MLFAHVLISVLKGLLFQVSPYSAVLFLGLSGSLKCASPVLSRYLLCPSRDSRVFFSPSVIFSYSPFPSQLFCNVRPPRHLLCLLVRGRPLYPPQLPTRSPDIPVLHPPLIEASRKPMLFYSPNPPGGSLSLVLLPGRQFFDYCLNGAAASAKFSFSFPLEYASFWLQK